MEDVPRVAVLDSGEKLESQPLLLDILQERPCTIVFSLCNVPQITTNLPHTIIERAMDILPDKEPVCASFQNTMVGKRIWYIRK